MVATVAPPPALRAADAWSLLGQVADPEIPVISVCELGIVSPGPVPPERAHRVRFAPRPVACPRCGAADTERISEFGSTACKALFRCRACGAPFDYFKPL